MQGVSAPRYLRRFLNKINARCLEEQEQQIRTSCCVGVRKGWIATTLAIYWKGQFPRERFPGIRFLAVPSLVGQLVSQIWNFPYCIHAGAVWRFVGRCAGGLVSVGKVGRFQTCWVERGGVVCSYFADSYRFCIIPGHAQCWYKFLNFAGQVY